MKHAIICVCTGHANKASLHALHVLFEHAASAVRCDCVVLCSDAFQCPLRLGAVVVYCGLIIASHKGIMFLLVCSVPQWRVTLKPLECIEGA